MILTVTLNPLLERRFKFSKILQGKVNRTNNDLASAGGKGINVSRQLNQLGIDNSAFTFTGGYSGKIYKHILASENIKASFVQTENETRNGSVVIDESGSVTTYLGKNTEVNDKEADEFLNRLLKMIPNIEMLVLSGSSPSPAADKIFPAAIKKANELDRITILDSYGSHLEECIAESPTIIHNNIDELKNLYKINSEEEILNILDLLYGKGIKQAYLTNGPSAAYVSNFDFHFRLQNPVIKEKDPTGSGDAFTAGIVYGWHNNLTFEETAIIASCLGAANAVSYDTCSVSLSDAEIFKNKVSIIPVGKKMKTVDVTPR